MGEIPNHDQRIELKYLLDEPLAQAVKQWAREHLGVDPHCCETLVDSYDVNTLYLDTLELDLYHRTGAVGATKHRIRRYSHEETLWLECKRKRKNVVRKNRTTAPANEVLDRLTSNPALDSSEWCGNWFSERVAKRCLRPTIQVHYRRFARTSMLAGESLRLTIDSQLQASRISGWDDSLANKSTMDLPRRDVSSVQILELKFHNHMPLLFKKLLQQFAIPTSSFSKFRSAVDAWGLSQSNRSTPRAVALLDTTTSCSGPTTLESSSELSASSFADDGTDAVADDTAERAGYFEERWPNA